jgi:hypothetical protein
MGRHSFMNGIKLGIPYLEKEETQFKSNLSTFFKYVDLVEEWQKLCLFENLHDLGFYFRNDIALAYFDKLIQKPEVGKRDYFLRMVEFIKESGDQ